MRLPVPFGGGLSTSRGVGSSREDTARELWNAREDRGVLEARPGFAVVQRFQADDTPTFGFGFGQYNGVREWVIVAQTPGDAQASLYVLTEGATWPLAQTIYSANQVEASSWLFNQFGQYLYAANETAGLFRRRVGATSGPEIWQKVNTRYRFNVEGSIDLADYTTRLWDAAGDTEESYVVQTYSPNDATTIEADGSWHLDQNDDRGNQVSAYAFFVCTFGTDLDLSASRYVTLTFTLEYDSADIRPQENPVFRPGVPGEEPICWVSTTGAALPATANFKLPWTGWHKAVVHEQLLDRDTLAVTIDFDAAQATGLNLKAIDRFAIGLSIRAGNGYKIHMSPMRRGGAFLSKPRSGATMTPSPESSYEGQLQPLEYAVQYYNSGTLAETSATTLTLAPQDSYGQGAFAGLIPQGAKATVSWFVGAGANSPLNFDKVRVWRRRWSDASRWWLISETANADGSLTDARVDDIADPVAWVAGTPVTRDSANDFSSVDQALKPQALAAWKGHMVLGVKQEVYISYGGTPELYVPPARDRPQLFDIDDPTLGRTLFMAQDASDECIGIVADDLLYLIGLRGVSVMVGDSAVDATPPRLLAGSRGAFGTRAFCKYQGGVLAANEEGLYWHRGGRALAGGSDSIYEFDNLTADVEPTWKRFTSDAGRNALMVVREWQGEIYCLIDSRYLKRDRFGKWSEGAFVRSALFGSPFPGGEAAGGAKLDTGGRPYEDDPGTGEAFPSGPYVNPNDLSEAPVSNPIHGVNDLEYVGLWWPPYDLRPGIGNQGFATGKIEQQSTLAGIVAEPAGRIVDLIGIEKIGMRCITYGGSMVQMAYNSVGVAYQSDNGWPIVWMRQSQAIEFADFGRFDVTGVLCHTAEHKTNSQPIRVILTTFDGKHLHSQTYYDFSGGLEVMPNLKRLAPGIRAYVIIAGRSASRRMERMALSLENKETRGI